jgi:hypothetical protein
MGVKYLFKNSDIGMTRKRPESSLWKLHDVNKCEVPISKKNSMKYLPNEESREWHDNALRHPPHGLNDDEVPIGQVR